MPHFTRQHQKAPLDKYSAKHHRLPFSNHSFNAQQLVLEQKGRKDPLSPASQQHHPLSPFHDSIQSITSKSSIRPSPVSQSTTPPSRLTSLPRVTSKKPTHHTLPHHPSTASAIFFGVETGPSSQLPGKKKEKQVRREWGTIGDFSRFLNSLLGGVKGNFPTLGKLTCFLAKGLPDFSAVSLRGKGLKRRKARLRYSGTSPANLAAKVGADAVSWMCQVVNVRDHTAP
ncbi:hypothetical protein B0J18DRAFT_226496 [Chaetomium sp. MPI-SDFR-AT-0129]|nr:hypothetical protein B0J18DRAFT_226496 [Chaetomium sp. MPI-SDFR-AT-0129]